jgi:hypothetical protein
VRVEGDGQMRRFARGFRQFGQHRDGALAHVKLAVQAAAEHPQYSTAREFAVISPAEEAMFAERRYDSQGARPGSAGKCSELRHIQVISVLANGT